MVGIGDWDRGGIGDRGLGIEIVNRDWGLDWELGFRIRIGIGDWELGLGIGIWIKMGGWYC